MDLFVNLQKLSGGSLLKFSPLDNTAMKVNETYCNDDIVINVLHLKKLTLITYYKNLNVHKLGINC
jgi:hypothetical protein